VHKIVHYIEGWVDTTFLNNTANDG